MEVLYDDAKLRKLCADEREMRKKRADIADKLRLRVNALNTATDVADLVKLDPLGKWHQLGEDRAGQWAGKLSGNWRLIIVPSDLDEPDSSTTVTAIEIVDYH